MIAKVSRKRGVSSIKLYYQYAIGVYEKPFGERFQLALESYRSIHPGGSWHTLVA
jgi:hypothetical protein